MTEQLEVRPALDRPALDVPAPDKLAPDKISRPVTKPRRSRLTTPVVALVVVGLTGLVAWRLLGNHTPAPQAGRQGAAGAPQSVGVGTVGTGDLDVVLTGLGAVTPLATVTVKTQINGQLQQIAFTEGQLVHAGDFLAQIDPRPYQVALQQAQGTLAHDQGLLAQARADNVRYQTLSKQDSISHQQVEDQVYLVKQYEGTVIADQGVVDNAKLNLVYCHIVSPVDGRVGIRMVDQGNYVQTSDTTGLVVVTQLQPISVVFTLPEDNVTEVQQGMAAGTLQVTAYDRSDTKLIATGTLATTDNQIDPTTGTVKLRAMFPNTDNALFPQQFVNAHLQVRGLHGVVVAPQSSIQHGAPGDFVYLVKPDNTVGVQVVKLGVSQGNRVQILNGLKPGDRVVTDGLDRLREGARITVATPPGQDGAAPGGRRGRRPDGDGQNGQSNAKPADANPANAKPADPKPAE